MNADKMHGVEDTAERALLVALELSLKKWRVAMAPVGSVKRRVTEIEGGDYAALTQAVTAGKQRFGLASAVPVVFCYEAGRDGFYPCRRLEEAGHTVWVVDSSSIEVSRQQRRAKSDGIDVDKLLALMQRQAQGDRALKVVRVPTPAQEDERQRIREREELRGECAALRTRMRSLVFLQGWRDVPSSVRGIGRWLSAHEERLGFNLRERLRREYARLDCVQRQLQAVDAQLRAQREAANAGEATIDAVSQRLVLLRGIADTGAATLSAEMFGWRRFRNRREVGACAGLTPTPYQSGDSQREQGISKAGNRRVRRLIVQLSWQWLRHQPDSVLTQWFQRRYGGTGKRGRRVGIVALARKLLIALWRYVEDGEVPAGARLKAA